MSKLNRVWDSGDLVSIAIPMARDLKDRVERLAEYKNVNASDYARAALIARVEADEQGERS